MKLINHTNHKFLFCTLFTDLKKYDEWMEVTGREAQSRQIGWETKWKLLQNSRAEWWQRLNQQEEGHIKYDDELQAVGTPLVPEVNVIEQGKQLEQPENQQLLQNIPENIDEEAEAEEDGDAE